MKLNISIAEEQILIITEERDLTTIHRRVVPWLAVLLSNEHLSGKVIVEHEMDAIVHMDRVGPESKKKQECSPKMA